MDMIIDLKKNEKQILEKIQRLKLDRNRKSLHKRNVRGNIENND